MFKELNIATFLKKAASLPIIDVRSPGEYQHGHIPGSFNIPLFDNEQRAQIGTKYVQQGRNDAILVGLKIVGPKMTTLVNQARQIAKDHQVLVHCWRGGMRSESFAWLLNTADIRALTLEKGYKHYRNFVLKSFEKPAKLILLGGETGSGKTDILKELAQQGEQVIDLEHLARHKGSAFGGIGQEGQPTAEQFENELAKVWNQMDFSKRIWIEDESHGIGRITIPQPLWQQMKAAPIIRLRIPKSERIKRLVREYGAFDKKDLTTAIKKIQKRLGGLRTDQALEALKATKLEVVADITLTYYDRAYNFNHAKKDFTNVFFIDAQTDDPQSNTYKVLDFAKIIKNEN